jgi:hypothetical protein
MSWEAIIVPMHTVPMYTKPVALASSVVAANDRTVRMGMVPIMISMAQ